MSNWEMFIKYVTFQFSMPYHMLGRGDRPFVRGFHRTFATGVACRQGTLTPPDTWSRDFGTCICSTCWDQSFSELVVILPDYALRISLGTFAILLRIYLQPRFCIKMHVMKYGYNGFGPMGPWASLYTKFTVCSGKENVGHNVLD